MAFPSFPPQNHGKISRIFPQNAIHWRLAKFWAQMAVVMGSTGSCRGRPSDCTDCARVAMAKME
jgi:hypothetical protein